MEILYKNATVATMEGDAAYGLLTDGAIGISNGKIAYIGSASDAPNAEKTIDCAGRLITPALIDCHTHLVYGGNRAKEFELRLQGASYEEIARNGGGIRSTVTQTRAASESALLAAALPRLDALIAEGATTVEVKSGYGLDTENEIKMLRVARQLEKERKIRIRTTFLGAHALPPEFSDNADGYIDHICNEMLPAAHAEGLIDAVDGFCEGIGFSPAQITRVFDTAKALSIPVKLHAEQLSNLGGAKLAASYGALSADHLEHLAPEDCATLAEHGTVAVLLPGAFYALRETKPPPVQALRNAGTTIAIATDSNPGSSPLTSLLLAMNMACTLFRLTPEEALRGTTIAASQALGLQTETGSIAVGKSADLAIWNVSEPAELCYHIGFNPLHQRIFKGHAV